MLAVLAAVGAVDSKRKRRSLRKRKNRLSYPTMAGRQLISSSPICSIGLVSRLGVAIWSKNSKSKIG